MSFPVIDPLEAAKLVRHPSVQNTFSFAHIVPHSICVHHLQRLAIHIALYKSTIPQVMFVAVSKKGKLVLVTQLVAFNHHVP